MKSIIPFQEMLERESGQKLKLRLNDNRSTMLSVRWEPDCTRVSLHRMFLKAPQNVMQSLVCYLRREHPDVDTSVKVFIEENLRGLDYFHRIAPGKMVVKGEYYDLGAIYRELNIEYFNNQLNLNITWYGRAKQKRRSQATFGLYYHPMKLIKIHRILDDFCFPEYLVSFVVYHEMLHAIHPPYFTDGGRRLVHSPEFKAQERRFSRFAEAQQWINEHQRMIFQ